MKTYIWILCILLKKQGEVCCLISKTDYPLKVISGILFFNMDNKGKVIKYSDKLMLKYLTFKYILFK
jgi:uncharacterized membrane protein